MHRTYSTALMMWTWQDDQVEHPELLERALNDMAGHGFSGVLAMLRGCRYEVSDPAVVAAARHASAYARRLGLAFWFALDPRLDQGRILRESGECALYLLPQREASGALPCEVRVGSDGRYSVRIEYGKPRGQHMLSQVAVAYEPESVEKVFLYRKDAEGRVMAASVRDITGGARLFMQRGLQYIEIFGRVFGDQKDPWYVLALPRFRSNYPELGGAATRAAILELYRLYERSGVGLDGVLWDEIGYVTSFSADRSRLPYGEPIRSAFAARSGTDLADNLLYLLLDDDAGRFDQVRRDYFAAVQEQVFGAQELGYAEARRLWGQAVESGIHQTWHQSANDLVHGSGDWWAGSAALTGGFTDVGLAEECDREERKAEVLAMAATAVTLARYHQRSVPFYNLWGVNYGEPGSPYPAGIMDWWAHLMSAMGINWLAHTYGPNGYMDNFTNWGPGYPNHPTWERFTDINRRIAQVREVTGDGLPEANVAVVYPLGALARLGSAAANLVAQDAQRCVARLMLGGVAADVISPAMAMKGELRRGLLHVPTPRGLHGYSAVVWPHASGALTAHEGARVREWQAAGFPVLLGGSADQIDHARLPRLIEAPAGTLAFLFRREDGHLALTVVPDTFGQPVTGEVRHQDLRVAVHGLQGIAAVRFSPRGDLVDMFAFEGEVAHVPGA